MAENYQLFKSHLAQYANYYSKYSFEYIPRKKLTYFEN